MKIDWLIHNFWMKIGALFLAVILWFYVAGEERIETELKIPIELKLAEGMVVTEQNAAGLEVLIRGRKEVVSRLMEEQLLSQLDFTSYIEPQRIVFPIERQNIPLNPEIIVLKIAPAKLEVKLDKLIQKVLPVQVLTSGGPAPGYRLEGFIVDPISAMVKGPAGYLQNLKYIKTESIDITGRQKSFKKMVPLESIPTIGEKIPTQFIEVVVRIEPEQKSEYNIRDNREKIRR